MSWEKRAAWAEVRQLADTLEWHVERWNELGAEGGRAQDGGPPGPWIQEIASEVEALLVAKAIAVDNAVHRLRQAADAWEAAEDTSTTALRAIEDDPTLLEE